MASVFQLEVDDRTGLATLTFNLPGKSVNVFTRAALSEFDELLDALAKADDIRCLVLLSGKRGSFIAGADVEEIAGVTDPIEAEAGARLGQELFQRWADLPYPTVSAIQGTCLGGGTELSLASDHIVISNRSDIRIGLPEIRLGIVPAWGGCSRLPQRIGLTAALDIILAGKAVNSRKAFKLGLADALFPDASFLHHVRDFADSVIGGTRKQANTSDLRGLLLEKNPLGRKVVFDQARKQVLKRTGGHYPAPLRAIEVIKVGMERGLPAGLEAEARATGELAVSRACKNLTHLFGLMEASKRRRTADSVEPRAVHSAAVVGAGLMGGGIAQILAQKGGLPVRVKDLDTAPLAHALSHASGLFRKLVKRRRITEADARTRMNLLHPALDDSGLARVDLVIEAIVEDLEIKQKVFAGLAAAVPADAILASNTSSLSIDLIGKDAKNRDRVVGMHFFNPVDKMPLVEVVAGAQTSAETVATIVDLALRLGKTPVVVKDGPGFLVNRLLMFYMAEALWLLDEGCSIEDIDRAMSDWGMPMGPMALTDEVGLDVAVKVAHILGAAFGDRLPVPGWIDHLSELDRKGAKTGLGIYEYEDGKRSRLDPEIYRLIGLSAPNRQMPADAIVERLMLPMVNEAARCLEEAVVGSAGELDLAMIMGTGFPPFRGGLCRWADQQDLDSLDSAMQSLREEIGERFAPSRGFEKARTAGGFYACFG